jgi:hypothetical protein
LNGRAAAQAAVVAGGSDGLDSPFSHLQDYLHPDGATSLLFLLFSFSRDVGMVGRGAKLRRGSVSVMVAGDKAIGGT